jgi:hypothetical protein
MPALALVPPSDFLSPRRTVVQVIALCSCTVVREIDATGQDAQQVADKTMETLNPRHYFTRVSTPPKASRGKVAYQA